MLVSFPLRRTQEQHNLVETRRTPPRPVNFTIFVRSTIRVAAADKREEDLMGNLVAHCFLSLDGVMGSPQQWHHPYYDQELRTAEGKQLSAVEAVLLGRMLYQEWVAHFAPKPPEEFGEFEFFARFIKEATKYVVSTTLPTVDWENTTLIRGDVAATVARLKQQFGGEIAIFGSATLVQSMLAEGLLDGLRLTVDPVIAGTGKRLFTSTDQQRPLRLADAKTFNTGALSLTYMVHTDERSAHDREMDR